ncbi:MAG: Hpt domain-containing protein [Rhizobiaceae bacterium]
MSKTLKANSVRLDDAGSVAKPIDLVHLSAQTMGDLTLENEILEIFLRAAEENIALWKDAIDQDARKRAAHSLKGGARGIGAWELAEVANKAEVPGFEDVTELEKEAKRVCSYIRMMRNK